MRSAIRSRIGVDQPAGQLARSTDVPRPEPVATPTPSSSSRRPTTSRWRPARAAVGHDVRGELCRQPVDAAGSEFRGINEPGRDLLDRCDVTQGGSRALCDEQLPNPFYQVPGFEGTARFTNPTLSRFELSRPFPALRDHLRDPAQRRHHQLPLAPVRGQPALGEGPRRQRQLHLRAQVRADRRIVRLDAVRAGNRRAQRVHRSQHQGARARAVLDAPASPHLDLGRVRVPVRRDAHRPDEGRCSTGGRSRRCSSISPGSPGGSRRTPNWSATRRWIPTKDGQFIYGVQPCVGQRNASGSYTLFAYSVTYGCTEPFFLIREPFQARTTMSVDDRLRRPGYWQLDLNFAKTTHITDRIRFQLRVEAFNVFNSPMYDERDFKRNTASDDFGRINRNIDRPVQLPAVHPARVQVDLLSASCQAVAWPTAMTSPRVGLACQPTACRLPGRL